MLLGTLAICASAGCTTSSSFECAGDSDCGSDGRCEVTGFCSFPDAGCESGYRYGDLAESLSNQCVVEEDPGTTAPVSTGAEATSTSSMSTTGTSGTSVASTDPTAGSSESTASLDDGGSTSSTSTEGDDSGSTTGDDTTTGDPLDCLFEDFDGESVPGLPTWSSFSVAAGDLSVADSNVIIPVEPMNGGASAGIRTDIPTDLTLSGSATAVVTSVAELDVLASSLSLADETFANPAGRLFVVLNGSVRVESFDGITTALLATQPLSANPFPLTLAFVVVGDTLRMEFTANDAVGAELLYEEPLPPWLVDAYVSFDISNPSSMSPVGQTAVDSIEVCPPPAG